MPPPDYEMIPGGAQNGPMDPNSYESYDNWNIADLGRQARAADPGDPIIQDFIDQRETNAAEHYKQNIEQQELAAREYNPDNPNNPNKPADEFRSILETIGSEGVTTAGQEILIAGLNSSDLKAAYERTNSPSVKAELDRRKGYKPDHSGEKSFPFPMDDTEHSDAVSYTDRVAGMNISTPDKSRMTYKKPSLTNALKNAENTPVYSEQVDPNLDAALSPKVALGTLGQQTPEQRARAGAQYGADIGKQNGGEIGALIGGSMGAVAARSAGTIQSGEHELNTRIGKLGETVNNLGLLDKQGSFKFSDGTTAPFLLPQGTKLPNLNTSILSGASDRLITELDPTNPLSKRAGCVAAPLGRYLMSGVLGYSDKKDPKNVKSAKDAVNIFTNSLITGADNIDTVYSRGREIIKKLKVPKDQMMSFFRGQAGSLSEAEAKEIKQGIDILYSGK